MNPHFHFFSALVPPGRTTVHRKCPMMASPFLAARVLMCSARPPSWISMIYSCSLHVCSALPFHPRHRHATSARSICTFEFALSLTVPRAFHRIALMLALPFQFRSSGFVCVSRLLFIQVIDTQHLPYAFARDVLTTAGGDLAHWSRARSPMTRPYFTSAKALGGTRRAAQSEEWPCQLDNLLLSRPAPVFSSLSIVSP